MIDGTELQLIGIERRDRLLRVCGYAAVTAFCAVSFGANLQYGLSLGKTPIDKTTHAAASVAADVFKMAAPLLDDPDVEKYYVERVALHRGGEPAELAGTIAYLLSDDASYVTSATLLVDGGFIVNAEL